MLLLLQRAKPAVLLDYVFTDAKPLVPLLQSLQSASGVQRRSHTLAVLVILPSHQRLTYDVHACNDCPLHAVALLSWSSHCHVICNLQQTLERLEAVLTAGVTLDDQLMIGFAARDLKSSLTPRFLDRAEMQVGAWQGDKQR